MIWPWNSSRPDKVNAGQRGFVWCPLKHLALLCCNGDLHNNQCRQILQWHANACSDLVTSVYLNAPAIPVGCAVRHICEDIVVRYDAVRIKESRREWLSFLCVDNAAFIHTAIINARYGRSFHKPPILLKSYFLYMLIGKHFTLLKETFLPLWQ